MKTISQYKEDIKALLEKSGELDARAIAENRDLISAEVDLKNKILDQVESYNEMVKSLERQEKIQTSLAKPEAAVTRPQKTAGVEVGIDNRSKEKFPSFGAQLAAVMRAGSPGGSADPRLFNAASGLNETVPSDGGFLVQSDFSTKMLQDVFATGKLASLCQRVTISGNANGTKMNGVDETSRATGSRYGGIRGYWEGEADEKTKSKPKFRQIELNLKKLIGLCYATDENLQDSSQLEGVIRQGFNSEFGFLVDDAIVNGTGAGQPLGILNAGCLVQASGVNGQGGVGVRAENIIEMWGRLFVGSRSNAVWLVNQEVEMALMSMHLLGATGGIFPVYMPPGGLSQAPYGTIFGRPVMPIEHCAAIGTVGDIILADFANGYMLAEKGGVQSDVSIHVRFIYDESVFRFVLRIDGQPVRAKALTPFKGSGTLSHFVALSTARNG